MRENILLKTVLMVLILTGIIFIVSGIDTYNVQHGANNWIAAPNNSLMNYTNEIKGVSFLLVGTIFITTGLHLMVRLKEKN